MTTVLEMFEVGGDGSAVSTDICRFLDPELVGRISAHQGARGGGTLEAVLRGVGTTVVETSPWPMFGIELFDIIDNRLLAWTSAGFDASAVEVLKQWPWEGDPAVTAARRNRVLTVPDVLKADEFPHTRRQAVRSGFRSAVYVPVQLSECWAVLTFCKPEIHDYTAAELTQAESLASLAAIALESAMSGRARLDTQGSAAGKSVRDLQPLVDAHDRLLRLQAGGATVGDVCRGVSGVLGLPVLLLDRFLQPLGAVGLSADDAAELIGGLAAETKSVGEIPGLSHLSQRRREVVITNLSNGGDRLGSLVTFLPPGEQPAPMVTELIEVASGHLTSALLRQRATVEAELRVRQNFGEALGSMNADGLALAQSAAMLGIQLGVPQRVMRVHPEGLEQPLSSHDGFEVAELLAKRLADNGFEAVVSPVGGVDFVLVLRDKQARRGVSTPEGVVRAVLREALKSVRGTAAAGVGIAIGVGDAGVGVDGLDRSHREANRALEVARLMDGDDSERNIADVGSYAVLAASSAVSAVDQQLFVRRYLEPLMDYDRVHNAGCVETLQTYFECVANVQRTADKLFLHLSTVRYRLKRIEEIAQIDLREEEDRLCMQLALRLTRFGEAPRNTA